MNQTVTHNSEQKSPRPAQSYKPKMQRGYGRQNRPPVTLPRSLTWLSLALLLGTTVVLIGCAGKPQVIAQPCPPLPALPRSLMEPPPTLDLIPEHLRPRASGLNPTAPGLR